MSKNNTIQKLRMILDNDSKTNKIKKDDKKYIISLEDRLKKQNQVIYYKRKDVTEGNGSLKPKVVVYPRKKHKIKISKFESKSKTSEIEIKSIDEKLFEVEKTTDIPNFLEVKPKKIWIKGKQEQLLEWKAIDEIKPKEDITEWETIEKEKTKEKIDEWEPVEEKIVELETIEEEKEIEPKEEIGEWKTLEEEKEIEPKEEIGEWEIVKKTKPKTEMKEFKVVETEKKEEIIETKEKQDEWIEPEYVEVKTKELKKDTEDEIYEKKEKLKKVPTKEPIELKEKNIEVFKDFKNIDNNTAMLLIDNGYKDIDSLKKASFKDLKKIKGIKRKKAKDIIKELDEDEEWEIVDETPKPSKKKIKKLKKDKKKDRPKKQKSKPSKEKISKPKKRFNKFFKSFKRKTKDKKIKEEVEAPKDVSEEDFYMEETDIKPIKKTKDTSKKQKKKQGYNYKKYTLYEKVTTSKKGIKRTIRFFSKKKPEDAKPIKLPKGYIVKENKKTGVPYIKKNK